MTPQDFANWTREDWYTFDALREAAARPTEAELAAQVVALREREEAMLVAMLTPYWPNEFVMPTTDEEWQEAFALYIFGPNGDLREWIGADLDGYYAIQMTIAAAEGYFEAFKRMVFSLET